MGWWGGRKQGEGGREIDAGRERQWRKGGLREGGLMKGTSEEGTGRGMKAGKEEASGGGIERGREGAREGNFKGGILRSALASIQYIHKPSHNAALAIDTLLLQMKKGEQV